MLPGWTWGGALLVMGGGALGSLARWSVGLLLNRGVYPWGTLVVNIVGSFFITLLIFGTLPRGGPGPEARTLLATGILGGFTTMSAFALETTLFLDRGEASRASFYALVTLAASLAAALLGRALAKALS